MRTRTILIGALLLASAGLAQAQDQQQQTTTGQAPSAAQTQATPASSFVPKYGKVNFGYRGESLSGDESRYYRFRDLRDGAYLDGLQFSRETDTVFFNAEANNVGYRDQRYFGEVQAIGKAKASFEWNQVPLYLANQSETWYTDNGNGVLGISDSIQQALQTAAGQGTAARDAAIALATTQMQPYDLRARRDIAAFNMAYTFNRDVDFKLNIKNTNRNGNQVMAFGFGTSPGLLPAVEMGVPIDDRTTDLRGVLEFANAKGMFAVGYDGSWYNQNVPLVRFDNPMRVTDISAGPSQGQMAWWPTNSAYSFNVNGNYKIAPRTRATAAMSFGRWEQDESLPPMTVNTALVAPPLERASAETRADIRSVVVGLNSRPVSNVWLNARYRYYDYENKTPHFTSTNAIIGDWAAGTQIHETEPASFDRKTLDLDASFSPHQWVSVGAGYTREDSDRTFRIFEKTAEDVVRFTMDSTGNDYVSVRVKYEFGSRTGSGFEPHLLEEVGEQPETRHYDVANRDRSRLTTLFTVTPVPYLSLNASVGTGNDEYDDTGFGLRDNENNNWSVGFDVAPGNVASFGVNYGQEKMTAYQYSRTSNPLPNPTFDDPTRDWSIDSDDEVKTTNVYLDLIKALPKTDIRMSYDLSDGKATYVYGGPAISNSSVFPTVPVTQLQPVKNELTMARFDVQHFIRPNVALGVAYHYEEYKVDDFSLDTDTINRLDARNGTTNAFASTFYTGYLFRPYTAHTFWLRMTYLW